MPAPATARTTPWPNRSSPRSKASCPARSPGPPGPPPGAQDCAGSADPTDRQDRGQVPWGVVQFGQHLYRCWRLQQRLFRRTQPGASGNVQRHQLGRAGYTCAQQHPVERVQRRVMFPRRPCTAAGYLSRGRLQALAEHWNGTSWSVQRGAMPRGSNSSNFIACPALPRPSVPLSGTIDILGNSLALAEQHRHRK
jgi:hypothetical protein